MEEAALGSKGEAMKYRAEFFDSVDVDPKEGWWVMRQKRNGDWVAVHSRPRLDRAEAIKWIADHTPRCAAHQKRAAVARTFHAKAGACRECVRYYRNKGLRVKVIR